MDGGGARPTSETSGSREAGSGRRPGGCVGDRGARDRRSGKVVCPGVVDTHSHGDFSILAEPTADARSGRASRPRSRQLRLELRADDPPPRRHPSRPRAFGLDKPTVDWWTVGEHLEFLSASGNAEHRVVRRSQRDPDRRRLRGRPRPRSRSRRWRASSRRRCRRWHSGSPPGSSSPGRGRRRTSCGA